MAEPKIYVLQHPTKRGAPLDISDAVRYGILQTPIFPPHYNSMLDATDAVLKLETALVDYTSEDYIIAIGDPVLIGISMAVGARNAQGVVQILKWNRMIDSKGTRAVTNGNYVPVSIKLDVQ